MIPLFEPLPPIVLDALLAKGWYRMRQHVFTATEIWLDDERPIPVWWARIDLENFSPNSRHRRLGKLCSSFDCRLQDAVITDEIEELYAQYRHHIDFDASESAGSFLLDIRGENFFPARMWQLRDAGRLVAVSYFDEGLSTAAGILTFYHPDYKRYSPGLFLYFESIRQAAVTGKRYFYPGYIALGYHKFDYKLLAGKERIELWDPENGCWLAYADSEYARLHMS